MESPVRNAVMEHRYEYEEYEEYEPPHPEEYRACRLREADMLNNYETSASWQVHKLYCDGRKGGFRYLQHPVYEECHRSLKSLVKSLVPTSLEHPDDKFQAQ